MVRAELAELSSTLGHYPSDAEFKAAGKTALRSAAYRWGTREDWARELGADLAPGSRRTTEQIQRLGPACAELYTSERLGSREIGKRLGLDHSQVLALLHDQGITVRPSGRTLTRSTREEDLVAAAEAYTRHGTLADAAADLGRSRKAVGDALHDAGHPVARPGNPARDRITLDDQQVVELHKRLRSYKRVAEILGVSESTVRRRVIKNPAAELVPPGVRSDRRGRHGN